MSQPILIHCLYSCADLSTRERIWLHVRHTGGWMSDAPLGTLFYVQRELMTPLLLLDPFIRRIPQRDYYL